jgi:hypothetical protein
MARVALLGAVLALAAAAPASADSILYRCFPNLCRVAADGSAQAPLTRDGASGGPVYGWLSATPDGSRIGATFGNRAVVLDRAGRRVAGPLQSSGGAVLVAQISPDGGQVATIETVIETVPGPPRSTPFLFLAGAGGSGRETVARATVATAWLGGRLLREDHDGICVLASNTDFPCERLVAAGPDLRDPAVSPDGALIAVTRVPGEIAIYTTATAQLVRVVSSGPDDSSPTWSPDGRRIAYAHGDDGLWVTDAGGPPGAARPLLASGSQPVWVRGGGPLRLSGPRRPRAGRVKIRMAGAPRDARVRLQRRSGGRWRALATRRARSTRLTFRVRLPRGRAVLRAQALAPGGVPTVSRRLVLRVR